MPPHRRFPSKSKKPVKIGCQILNSFHFHSRLNLACCSLDETIESLLVQLIETNQTIKSLNISANRLGQKIGESIMQVIHKNKVIQELDIRNSDISYDIKSAIDSIILDNRDRTVFEWS